MQRFLRLRKLFSCVRKSWPHEPRFHRILFSAWWRLGRFLTSGLVQFILPVFAQLVSQSYRVFSACAESARTSLAESAQKADEIMNQFAKTQMFQWTVKLTSITTCGLLLMAFIQAPLVLIGLSVILIACIEQVRLTLSILAPTIVTDTLVATPAKSPVVMPSLASVKMPSPVVINIPMTPAALAQTVKEKMFNSDQPSPAPVVAPRGPLTPLRPSIMNSNTMAAVSGKDKTFAAVLAAAKTPKSSGIKRRMVDVTHDIEKENRCPNSDVPIKAWRMRQPGSIEAMAAAYKRKQMIQQQRRSTTMMR